MTSEYSPLGKAAVFIVQANRNSILSPRQREERIKNTKSGRLLSILFSFGFFGVLVYTFGTVLKTPSVNFYKNLVVEDHASKVIRNSLSRYTGKNIEAEFIAYKPGLFSLLKTWISSMDIFHSSFRQSEIKHVTEFVRVLTLFRYYLVWRAVFAEKLPDHVMLARTNDQKRTALGVVCEELSVPVLAYTVERAGKRPPAPYRIGAQLCWSLPQKEYLQSQGIEAAIMPVPEVNNLKLNLTLVEKTNFGFLLNAKADTEKVILFIKELETRHGIRQMKVRPHPGLHSGSIYLGPDIEISDWKEPLVQFLNSVDVVFALNTNASLDALLHGVPVIYKGDLDGLQYDLQGFVRDGIVLPYEETFHFPDTVTAFYLSDGFTSNWNTAVFTTDSSAEMMLIKEAGV